MYTCANESTHAQHANAYLCICTQYVYQCICAQRLSTPAGELEDEEEARPLNEPPLEGAGGAASEEAEGVTTALALPDLLRDAPPPPPPPPSVPPPPLPATAMPAHDDWSNDVGAEGR